MGVGFIYSVGGIDVSGTTATAGDVDAGKRFYTADGTRTTGTLDAFRKEYGQFTLTADATSNFSIPVTGHPKFVFVHTDDITTSSQLTLSGLIDVNDYTSSSYSDYGYKYTRYYDVGLRIMLGGSVVYAEISYSAPLSKITISCHGNMYLVGGVTYYWTAIY